MSRILVYQLLFFSNFYVPTTTCTENQCLLFRSENDHASAKFQVLHKEDGVRIVYFHLNLSVVENSYKSLHPDRIMPTRWTWAKTNKEPLLALSYDYDVLSLSLLKNQAKDLSLDLNSTQSQCLKMLNSSCQDLEISRALLDITKIGPEGTKTDVVCFRTLREYWFGVGSHFKYQCCKENMLHSGNRTAISCNVPVSESQWLAVFNTILAILVGVTVLYWLWIFCLLPNSMFQSEDNTFSLQNLAEKGSLRTSNTATNPISPRNNPQMTIPLDDFTPITVQTFFEKLGRDLFPNNALDLRLRLFLVWFGFIPLAFYTKILLYVIIKNDQFDETSQKLLFQVADFYFFVFNLRRPLVYVLFVIPFLAIPCAAIFLVPTQINYRIVFEAIYKSTAMTKENLENIKENCTSITKSILLKLSKSKMFSSSTSWKKYIASLYSIFYVILVVPICILTALVLLLTTSVLCLARFSPFLVFLLKLLRSNKLVLYQRIFFIYSTISATFLVTFSCQYLIRMLGFVIMGIILNAEFVMPYMTFAFVVGKNISLCFSNTQRRYKELKKSIADKFEEKIDRIPEKLFWCVSDTVLPVADEMFALFIKILAIVVLLSIALTAILLFQVTYDASAIVPTISVFISGKFSEMFFSRVTTESSFVGWEKIRLEERIVSAIQEYLSQEDDETYLKR